MRGMSSSVAYQRKLALASQGVTAPTQTDAGFARRDKARRRGGRRVILGKRRRRRCPRDITGCCILVVVLLGVRIVQLVPLFRRRLLLHIADDHGDGGWRLLLHIGCNDGAGRWRLLLHICGNDGAGRWRLLLQVAGCFTKVHVIDDLDLGLGGTAALPASIGDQAPDTQCYDYCDDDTNSQPNVFTGGGATRVFNAPVDKVIVDVPGFAAAIGITVAFVLIGVAIWPKARASDGSSCRDARSRRPVQTRQQQDCHDSHDERLHTADGRHGLSCLLSKILRCCSGGDALRVLARCP
mmetsp:Transcript_23645/g.79963  ORF Transcript_23645/g.79963 Transcript_23645/m.79963 type:complete len:296 (+) Transcript_23645:239-1126(+)